MNQIYLCLGSNHNPRQNLQTAIDELLSHGKITCISNLYESPNRQAPEQTEKFVNLCIKMHISESADSFKKDIIQPIEQKLGRVREVSSKIVSIDIDTLLFNDDTLTLGKRQIPDPDIARYAHIAIPLAEIAEHYFHKPTQESIQTIVNRLSKQTITKLPYQLEI